MHLNSQLPTPSLTCILTFRRKSVRPSCHTLYRDFWTSPFSVGCETARPALESQTSQVQTISAGLQNLQLEDASEKEELSVEDMSNTKREEELTRIASLKHEKTSAVTRFDDSLLNARSETCESGVTSSEPRVLQPELSSSGVVCETADKTSDSQRNSVDIPSAKAASSSRTTDSVAEEDIEDKCQALDLRFVILFLFRLCVIWEIFS